VTSSWYLILKNNIIGTLRALNLILLYASKQVCELAVLQLCMTAAGFLKSADKDSRCLAMAKSNRAAACSNQRETLGCCAETIPIVGGNKRSGTANSQFRKWLRATDN